MRKKIIGFLLISALALSSLAGCGRGNISDIVEV